MLLPVALATLLAQLPVDPHAGESALSQLRLDSSTAGFSFAWSDSDDALKGAIAAKPPRVGAPLVVSAAVQPLSGPDYDGPVTISLRPLESLGSTETSTVTRAPGERTWVATFVPTVEGPHRLELSWRTTHHKVVRAVLDVAPAGLPPWLNWAVGVGLVTLAVLGGVWSLFRGKES